MKLGSFNQQRRGSIQSIPSELQTKSYLGDKINRHRTPISTNKKILQISKDKI